LSEQQETAVSWYEAEDCFSCNRKPDIQDNWNAAAMRLVRLFPSCAPDFILNIPEEGQWTVTFRCRLSAEEPGILGASVWNTDVALEVPADGQWQWVSLSVFLPRGGVTLHIATKRGEIEVDGFFIHNQPIELPDKTHHLDAMIGKQEAEKCPTHSGRILPPFEVNT
jgi:hypothetical protein